MLHVLSGREAPLMQGRVVSLPLGMVMSSCLGVLLTVGRPVETLPPCVAR